MTEQEILQEMREVAKQNLKVEREAARPMNPSVQSAMINTGYRLAQLVRMQAEQQGTWKE